MIGTTKDQPDIRFTNKGAYVSHKGKEGFMARKPQFVIKICQEKRSMSKRGKMVKAKGLIKIGTGKNYFVLDFEKFIKSLSVLIKAFNENHKDFQINL